MVADMRQGRMGYLQVIGTFKGSKASTSQSRDTIGKSGEPPSGVTGVRSRERLQKTKHPN